MRKRNIKRSFLVVSLFIVSLILFACSKGGGNSSDDTNKVITDMDNDMYDSTVDCRDDDPYIHPGAHETIGDGVDSNCDGDMDDDGRTVAEGDCNDGDPTIHPGATEVRDDDIDQNCDGRDSVTTSGVGSGDEDNDFDGYSPNDGDCNDADPDINPGAVEVCDDGIDQDCDGIDPKCDNDGDGYTVDEGDCNDNEPTVHPGAVEECATGVDNNCDGVTSECDLDLDGDSYTISKGDCNDLNPDIHPNAIEGVDGQGDRDGCADGIDNNCNDIIDLEEGSCNEPVISGTATSSNCSDGVIEDGESVYDGTSKDLCGKYEVSFSRSTISVQPSGSVYDLYDNWSVWYRAYKVTQVTDAAGSTYFMVEWTGRVGDSDGVAKHEYREFNLSSDSPYPTDEPYAYPDYLADIDDSGNLVPIKYDCNSDPNYIAGSFKYNVCYDKGGHKITLLGDSSLSLETGEQFYFVPYSWYVRTADRTGRWADDFGYFDGEY